MSFFWLSFPNDHHASIEAKDALAAKTVAEHITGDPCAVLGTLPYPAGIQIQPSACPSFCHSPSDCLGKSSCPKNPACSE